MSAFNSVDLWTQLADIWGGQTLTVAGPGYAALSRLPLRLATGECQSQLLAVFDGDNVTEQAIIDSLKTPDSRLIEQMRSAVGQRLPIGNTEWLGIVVLSSSHPTTHWASLQEQAGIVGGRLKVYGVDALERLARLHPPVHQAFFGLEQQKIRQLQSDNLALTQEKYNLQQELASYRHEYEQLASRQKRLEQAEAWQKLLDITQHKLSTKLGTLKLTIDWERAKRPDDPVFGKLHKTVNELQDRLMVLEGRKPLGLNRREHSIENLLQALQQKTQQAGVKFAARPGTRGQIVVDLENLLDCVEELIANARYWTPSGSNPVDITIKAALRAMPDGEKMLEILCKDNGPGVDDRDKVSIFLPYITGRVDGKGLGLHMIKRFCEIHQGEAYENGKFHQGAQFVLRLPIKPSGNPL